MRPIHLLALATLTTASLLASDSVSTRGGGLSGGPSAGLSPGCPTASVEGLIAAVDPESGQFTILANSEETFAVPISDQTRFRVPGVKGKELRKNPLAHLNIDAPAKVTYCTTDSKVLEVRIKKRKART